MLGCSDARVPTELLFGQEFNDIFNIRVAGNVLAEEGIGSLLYALRNVVDPRTRSGREPEAGRPCSAIAVAARCQATVKAFQSRADRRGRLRRPDRLDRREDRRPACRSPRRSWRRNAGRAPRRPAEPDDLVELVVYLNAAWGAHEMQNWVEREGPEISEQVGVVFGVFDPTHLARALPPETPADPVPEALAIPPSEPGRTPRSSVPRSLARTGPVNALTPRARPALDDRLAIRAAEPPLRERPPRA